MPTIAKETNSIWRAETISATVEAELSEEITTLVCTPLMAGKNVSDLAITG
jgi:hypothetical protein